MTFRRVVLPLLLGGLLGSCSLTGPDRGPAVSLDLEVDKTILPIGETMIITARAQNVGASTLTLTGPMECLIYVEVFAVASGSAVYSTARGCTGATVTEEIAVGAQKEQVFTWAGVGDNGTRLPGSDYVLRAVARVTGYPYSGPTITIRLE